MGFFSWNTSDTGKSIGNIYSDKPHRKPIYMITEDGREWKEEAYEGYGVFGGKDIYELIAELNGFSSDRATGIDLVYTNNPTGSFESAAHRGLKMPKLVTKSGLDFNSIPYPKNCERQGFFYR